MSEVIQVYVTRHAEPGPCWEPTCRAVSKFQISSEAAEIHQSCGTHLSKLLTAMLTEPND